jgi:hypothetical protein
VTWQLLWNRTLAWKKEPGEKGQQPEGTKSEEVKAENAAEAPPGGQTDISAEQEADPVKGKKFSWFRFRRRKSEDPAP